MNIITHYLLSWTVAEQLPCPPRDRRLLCWAGIIPDLDGAGIVIDWLSRSGDAAGTDFYLRYHHALLHGLPGALLIAALLALCATRRLFVLVAALLMVHLHMLCDMLGSRGAAHDDIWPIAWLAPLSARAEIYWPWQWPLNGWQNVLITVAALGWGFYAAIRHGRSPLSALSTRADQAVVQTVRMRWASISQRWANHD